MDEADCGSYDPRLRYLTSTTNVKKAVMVLIDSGFSMGEIVAGSGSDSNLATAFSVTEAILNTTTKDDYVNIFTFNQSGVAPVFPKPVLVTNTSSHPDFDVFDATLSAPNPSSAPGHPGNITDAVSKVISMPEGFGSLQIPIEYLKVLILITDGIAVGFIANAASPLPWDLIKSRGINMFLYKFPNVEATNDSNLLETQLCAAQGSLITLDRTVFQDPLFALKAYFSFLANVYDTYVNSGISYSTEYKDHSQVDNRTFSLSKAVFDSNGELQAVAGIDIFKTKLQETYGIDGEAIEEAVRIRANRSASFNASAGVIPKPCLNQTLSTTCNNQTGQQSNIVCESDFNTGVPALQELSCCGACVEKSSDLALPLGLGLGLGVPVVIAMALVAWCCGKTRPAEKQRRIDLERDYVGSD